jgi:methionyl-tRNA formyltransferase
VKRELKRVGPLRFLDVLAFRTYYALRLAGKDRIWEQHKIEELGHKYPPIPAGTPVLHAQTPNSPEARAFIEEARPDIAIARCKLLLKEDIFTVPRCGTVVMHPGICPEYRNAHGCFWALANDDTDRVGMTMLRIDKGVDTGPVFGYFTCAYDEAHESHIVIQLRTVFDNLDAIRSKLTEICENRAIPVDTRGRTSAAWGQPWLTKYLHWKRQARSRVSSG